MKTTSYALGRYTLEHHWQDTRALRAIRDGGWDIGVLQEQSTRPVVNAAQMHTFARKLDAEIKATGARTVFFMTWAHRDNPAMLAGLEQACTAMGRELGAVVAPVGLAWQRSLEEHPNLVLHEPDNSHPLPHGTYLTACVFYATLTRHNPYGLSNGGLQQVALEDAHFLQRIAWETVTRYQGDIKSLK